MQTSVNNVIDNYQWGIVTVLYAIWNWMEVDEPNLLRQVWQTENVKEWKPKYTFGQNG